MATDKLVDVVTDESQSALFYDNNSTENTLHNTSVTDRPAVLVTLLYNTSTRETLQPTTYDTGTDGTEIISFCGFAELVNITKFDEFKNHTMFTNTNCTVAVILCFLLLFFLILIIIVSLVRKLTRVQHRFNHEYFVLNRINRFSQTQTHSGRNVQ